MSEIPRLQLEYGTTHWVTCCPVCRPPILSAVVSSARYISDWWPLSVHVIAGRLITSAYCSTSRIGCNPCMNSGAWCKCVNSPAPSFTHVYCVNGSKNGTRCCPTKMLRSYPQKKPRKDCAEDIEENFFKYPFYNASKSLLRSWRTCLRQKQHIHGIKHRQTFVHWNKYESYYGPKSECAQQL